MERFQWGRDTGCLPSPESPPYHCSWMSEQLLMRHNAAHSVYYAQRRVSASLWNARAYSRRSTYIKSVYKHYTVSDMKVTEVTERQLHGKRSPPQFVTNCSMRKPPGESSTSSRCLPSWLSPTWRINTQIQMYWLSEWLESYNNCTFSTWKDKFVLSFIILDP